MRDLQPPEVIFTHESDLDGLLSGVLLKRLAKKLFNTEVRIEAFHYNYWKQRDLRERAAWVADFTFETRMDKPEWLVVDHHVTDASPKYTRFIHDLNKSAATLCYELCKESGIQSPALDRLVHLNNVADLFLVDDPDFVLATDYASLVKSYQFWNLHTLIGGDIEKLVDHPLLEVMAVRRRVENPLGFEWSKSNVSEISSTVGFVDTVIGNNNLVVHQLLEQHATKYPVLVTLFRRGSLVFASFRSHNGEALKVAEKFQGGGHANAAGALLPKSIRTVPDGVDYLRQILNVKNHVRHSPLNSLENLFAAVEAKKT
ncbi:MAG TPA: DHH family phosphoesterase [Verrucomicrobiae bacterium]|jgi:oligoribonuclease NrnB/cAMP/cGMP phosphodiesterase (DHH superfamily)|nr:DHH family phosphoesterase [Verrucomicrobiae bacterium]